MRSSSCGSSEFEALIAGLHRHRSSGSFQSPSSVQGSRRYPRLAGEAKSYAERLFKFPRIGQLSPPQAEAALAEPAAEPRRPLRPQ